MTGMSKVKAGDRVWIFRYVDWITPDGFPATRKTGGFDVLLDHIPDHPALPIVAEELAAGKVAVTLSREDWQWVLDSSTLAHVKNKIAMQLDAQQEAT